MGRSKELKKQRKYARKEMANAFQKFKEEFKATDFLRPCPRFVPKILWNILVNLVIKKS